MLKHTRLTVVVAALLAAPAIAQEAMYTEAATTASPGTLIVREQFHYMRYGHNPVTHHTDTEKYEAKT